MDANCAVVRKALPARLIWLVTGLCLICIVAAGGSWAQGPQFADSAQINWADIYRYFDEPIDPDHYMIRPGEELLVTFVGAKIGDLKLSVNPEGRIIHQTLGTFDLARKSLTEARQILHQEIERLYEADQIEISVNEPRRVAVQVGGAVVAPGVYKAFTSQRVSELIELAGGVSRLGSKRKVTLEGGCQQPLAVDLDRVMYLGDNSSNPCLYAGQSIVVPDRSTDRVQVVGEVNNPREIELLPGDDLATLLALAGGLRNAAEADSIVMIRGNQRIAANETQPLAGDILFVPGHSANGHDLVIFGAIDKPGRYAWQAELTVETLFDKAGGTTTEASLGLVTVFRKAGVDAWGRASNWRYPIASNQETSDGMDMVLLPEDSVYVPFRVGYVKVTGEVLNPGLFPYQAGKTAQDFIGAAGGLLPSADTERFGVYNRVARVTLSVSPKTRVLEGYEIIVNRREELK